MTMTLIETKTLGAAAASIEFTSIPQTFTDLVFLISARSDGTNSTMIFHFNGDTTNTNYSTRRLEGSGSSVSSNSFAGPFWAYTTRSDYTANTFANSSVYIPNYTTAVNKSVSADSVQENNATLSQQFLVAGLWNNTAAITSVAISVGDPNYVAGTTISLYGILKGSDGIVTTS